MLARWVWTGYLAVAFIVLPLVFVARYGFSPIVVGRLRDRYGGVEWAYGASVAGYTFWLWLGRPARAWGEATEMIGLAVALASAGLVVAGSLSMGRSWRIGQAEDDPRVTLVRGVLQRTLGHPIYVGLCGLALGMALLDSHLRSGVFLAVTLVYCWVQGRAEGRRWGSGRTSSERARTGRSR